VPRRRARGNEARRQRIRRRLLIFLLLCVAAVIAAGLLRPQWFLQAALRVDVWWTGTEQVSVAVGGERIQMLRRGEFGPGRPVWVLVHGFTGMKENWLPLLRALPAELPVLVPDLPGWGDSERVAGADYGYAAQADRLAALLDAQGLDQVVLVGHSMGGGISAVMAARHPQRLRALVLMSASGIRFQDNAFGQAVLRGEHPFKAQTTAELRAYLSQVFSEPPWLPWPLPQALLERRQSDFDFELGVLGSIGRGGDAFLPARSALAIQTPTLLLWCRDDAVIDVSAAALYAEALPRSDTVLLEGCGHMPMMERPQAAAAALLEWERALP